MVRLRSALFPALTLALVLVGSKAVILGAPEGPHWLLDLMGCSWKDVLLAAAFGWVAAWLPRARSGDGVGRVALALGALLALWGAANVGIYDYFRRPFNLHMLDLVGHAPALLSSVAEHVTWQRTLALVAAPVGFIVATRAFERRLGGLSTRGVPGLLLPAAAWVGLGLYVYAGYPKDANQRRAAESPHMALATSAYERFTGRRALTLPRDFPLDDLEDHRPFLERPRAPSTLPPDQPRPHNVILIVLESTGARWLSLYGAPWNTWPRLTAESRHALVVDNVYSHEGYTFCSLMSLAFSTYPGLPWCWRPSGAAPLAPTLAQLLQPKGYVSAYIHSGDLDWEGMGYMVTGRGFDKVLGYPDLPGPKLTSWGTRDRYLFDGLLRFIDAPERAGRPFFAMCWTDQSHDPYALSPGVPAIDFFGGQGGDAEEGRYLNIVHEVDGAIGDLLDGLRARGLADDTLVVITGDHGESFGGPHDTRGHGSELYEENVHVPLVLWSPRLFGDSGRRLDAVGSHVDIVPTIVDALGLAPAPQWQGESFFARERSGRAYFETGISEYQFGVREGPWKYIYNTTLGTERLFHLPSDPDEREDLSAREPDRSARLRQRVAAFIAAEDRLLRGERVR